MDLPTLLAFAAAFFVFAASPGPDNMTIVARNPVARRTLGHRLRSRDLCGHPLFPDAGSLWLVDRGGRDGDRHDDPALCGRGLPDLDGHSALDREPAVPDLQPVSGRRGLFTIFATGVALNLGNPKMPLFYIALLPNVVGASLTLGHIGYPAAVILAVEIVVIVGHVLLATNARRFLRSPKTVRRANRTAGGMMVGAGIVVVSTR
jgi:threonine/homoserine/homoserine lactone efflux protein